MRLNFGGSVTNCYGWAEIHRDADATYTLVATAYNETPGQSILAGQTEFVPEPASGALTMSGLFVLGVAGCRRRRLELPGGGIRLECHRTRR